VHLHFHPDHRARLAADPSLWDSATDEFLRRYTPARAVARTCTAATELGGQELAPGDRVLASLSSGNEDDELFADPLTVTIDRPNARRHLSFGVGVHRCIGLHLARTEFQYVMREVLRRMPDYRVQEDELVVSARQSENSGWMQAPAAFTPGPRVLDSGAAELGGYSLVGR
jgi:cytochrome P450